MAKTEKVIGLWLDGESGEPPAWIVSDDLFDEHGRAITTTTVMIYAREDYQKARARALALGESEGVCVVETDEYGGQTTLYSPDSP